MVLLELISFSHSKEEKRRRGEEEKREEGGGKEAGSIPYFDIRSYVVFS